MMAACKIKGNGASVWKPLPRRRQAPKVGHSYALMLSEFAAIRTHG
jgi:hypothetical protein